MSNPHQFHKPLTHLYSASSDSTDQAPQLLYTGLSFNLEVFDIIRYQKNAYLPNECCLNGFEEKNMGENPNWHFVGTTKRTLSTAE